MATYYAFLWAITLLNLVRCILQMTRNGTTATHAALWNAFWLLTRFGEQELELNTRGVVLKTCLMRHKPPRVTPATLCNSANLACLPCLALPCPAPVFVGMIMLEASVVVYLLQGHTASGRKVREGVAGG